MLTVVRHVHRGAAQGHKNTDGAGDNENFSSRLGTKRPGQARPPCNHSAFRLGFSISPRCTMNTLIGPDILCYPEKSYKDDKILSISHHSAWTPCPGWPVSKNTQKEANARSCTWPGNPLGSTWRFPSSWSGSFPNSDALVLHPAVQSLGRGRFPPTPQDPAGRAGGAGYPARARDGTRGPGASPF